MLSTQLTTLIEGPAGQLELVTAEPIGTPREAWGIVCHPHPLHGGNMQNKVVTTLAKTFQQVGLKTVRFNFRGVGKSAGAYDEGKGELADLMAVIEWVSKKGDQPIWLAGFSFGAYVATMAAAELPISHLVTVAPPVTTFPMEQIPPITCPWVLVQGELDEVVPPFEVLAWAARRDPMPTILRFPQAGHFFHGQLVELRARLMGVL